MLCATAWIGMATEDVPNVIYSLGDFSQFASIPDRTQQGFLNFLFLGRLRTPALASGRSADAPSGTSRRHRPCPTPAARWWWWTAVHRRPPAGNVPPRAGLDPHGHPANSPAIRAMIARFLATGELVDTCAGAPCTAPTS
ncbi:hypothetical protein ACFOW4_00110 [Micromonospora sp. GCM10011542]|uniref:hypothetical protein n=1 Tax=Micromonospora sp. GCM10011542 TaxID=3317337 RepID=UPI003611D295